MVSTLASSSPPPSAVCLAHLHLELSFMILQLLLLFLQLLLLIIVIAAGGHVDHAKEVGVTDFEVVVNAEGAPPVLEQHSLDVVLEGPFQVHAPGLPSHL